MRHKNLVQLVGLVLHGPQVRSIVMELMGKVSALQQRGKRGEGRGEGDEVEEEEGDLEGRRGGGEEEEVRG